MTANRFRLVHYDIKRFFGDGDIVDQPVAIPIRPIQIESQPNRLPRVVGKTDLIPRPTRASIIRAHSLVGRTVVRRDLE